MRDITFTYLLSALMRDIILCRIIYDRIFNTIIIHISIMISIIVQIWSEYFIINVNVYSAWANLCRNIDYMGITILDYTVHVLQLTGWFMKEFGYPKECAHCKIVWGSMSIL